MSEQEKDIPFLQTFRSVILTNKEGKTFNITSIVSELSLFEDIYSNTLSGEVLIADGSGASDTIGITGSEKLTVELYKGEKVEVLDFFVYASNSRYRNNNTSEIYKLQFISLEGVLNEHTRVYQAFNGLNSASVQAIYKGYIASKKPLEVEETIGSYKFVMPGWTPFESINWYAGRSTGIEQRGNYFLFFETLSGFKFKSVEGLIKGDVSYTYRYEPTGQSFSLKDPSNIREYEVISMGDSVKGVKENNTTLWTNDLIRKKIVKKRYETSTDDKNGFGVSLKERRDIYGSEVVVKSESRNVHSQTQTYNYDSVQGKLSAMRRFSNLKIRFLAFGNRDIEVGKVVEMKFLQPKIVTSDTKDSAEDKGLSGRYLITAVRYIFKHQDFHMSVEAVKEQ